MPGRLLHEQKDGWTILYFADYSVDRRPGSHSTFITNAELSLEDMLSSAREAWPEVFLRPGSPALYLPGSETPITTAPNADTHQTPPSAQSEA